MSTPKFVLVLVLALTACSGSSETPQAAPVPERLRVEHGYEHNIAVTCDTRNGNLLYVVSMYQGVSIAVVPAGCGATSR